MGAYYNLYGVFSGEILQPSKPQLILRERRKEIHFGTMSYLPFTLNDNTPPYIEELLRRV